MSSQQQSQVSYELYTYFRSSCAARVRIAAGLKQIPLALRFIDLGKDEQHTTSFKALNPSGTVPVLIVHDNEGKSTVITQSLSILEYFEESVKISPLLPPISQPDGRAKVRDLVGVIANDVFPPVNSRVAQLVRAIRGEASDQITFVHKIMASGFSSYEKMLGPGRYSFGDRVTMADVCLVPAVDMAFGYKLDLSPYPRIVAIYDELMKIDAFKQANWRVQEDTPTQLKLST